MRRFFKPLLAAALLGSVALPFAPAEAQWVFVARKALGRIHQMTEGSQPDGRAGYDFATVLLDAHANGELEAGQTIVCTVTGNGLKDPDTALLGMPSVEPVPVDPTAVAGALGLE